MSPTSILDLPAEILSQILHQILFYTTPNHRTFREPGVNTTALLLTCRQFYRLILPVHYRELEFSHLYRQKASCLLRSLLSNSRLLQLVRSLKVVLQRSWMHDCLAIEDYTAAAEVLRLFRGVRVHTLEICGEALFSPEDWERLQDNVALQRPSADHVIDFSIAFDDLIEVGTPETATKFKEFYAWLQAHPHALRRMVFGDIIFHELGLGEFRATAFPNLHTIVCPTHYVLSVPNPRVYWPTATVHDQLLGPAVQTFVWDLTSYQQQHGAGLWDFDEKDEQWLLALAEGAAADQGTALKTIQIDFSPETDRTGGMSPEEYPWDRIERLQQAICALGIELEYSTPVLTRE
ncbi:hypothetical protein BO82DRAFT_389975 [Aspergillus uvarum CBS 121591]|uniref:F-box domain-containing protein n=1 Tax=Aspergillus uvarum CBS 121591 TaxID=1448315 RepID=A0A319CH73_9EURO|nr:hypothetical protein BO82DRAFT_389975 [Aspergillus uvarum CBS 121591]PYH84574.1 hypothetical protein BO82DRAFT_389975 [Aspergillus uvarum CBS 121591]